MRKDEEIPPATPRVDQAWLQRLEEVITKRMRESNLTMEQIAGDLHLSRSHFFRMLKANTGMTPNMYLREVRLFKARDLIDDGSVRSVKELSAAVGFDSPPYFSRLFFERFGYKPSDRL